MKITNISTNKNDIMKNTNWYINIGVGFVALAILIKFLDLQHDASNFIQGFSVGLGLVLIVRGFIAKRKDTNK